MRCKPGIRSLLSAALLCTATAALAADPPAQDPHAGHATSSGSSAATSVNGASASKQMHHTMMQGMKEMQSMPPSGDPDQDFATMMEHHHAQAVKMTQAYLKDAKDPQLKAWAQKSLNSQKQELQELQSLDVASPGKRSAEGTQR